MSDVICVIIIGEAVSQKRDRAKTRQGKPVSCFNTIMSARLLSEPEGRATRASRMLDHGGEDVKSVNP